MTIARNAYIEKITGKKLELTVQEDSLLEPPQARKYKSLVAQRIENFIGVSGIPVEEFIAGLQELGLIQ